MFVMIFTFTFLIFADNYGSMDSVSSLVKETDILNCRTDISVDSSASEGEKIIPTLSESGNVGEVESISEDLTNEENELKIIELDGRFHASFHMASKGFAYLNGRRLVHIERDTQTIIKIPKNKFTNDIKIRGSNKDGVLTAYRQLRLLQAASQSKLHFTHFVSIPLATPEFIRNFMKFKEEILRDFGESHNLTEHLFQKPTKLHLTIGITLLADNAERNLAVSVLTTCKHHIVDPVFQKKPAKINVRGVALMNSVDPTRGKVLYACIEDTPIREKLQEVVSNLVEFFVEKGLMMRSRQEILLHCTLMNIFFHNRAKHGRTNRMKHFDATEILERYKDYHFGEIEINSIHLSQKDATDENGYYKASCKIAFD